MSLLLFSPSCIAFFLLPLCNCNPTPLPPPLPRRCRRVISVPPALVKSNQPTRTSKCQCCLSRRFDRTMLLGERSLSSPPLFIVADCYKTSLTTTMARTPKGGPKSSPHPVMVMRSYMCVPWGRGRAGSGREQFKNGDAGCWWQVSFPIRAVETCDWARLGRQQRSSIEI